MKLGVSQAGVKELLTYEPEVVERQLDWLPYRKSRRPEAFIIEAVRKDFSPPHQFFHYAKTHRAPTATDSLDEAAEHLGG